jgi:hypothetical protein
MRRARRIQLLVPFRGAQVRDSLIQRNQAVKDLRLHPSADATITTVPSSLDPKLHEEDPRAFPMFNQLPEMVASG